MDYEADEDMEQASAPASTKVSSLSHCLPSHCRLASGLLSSHSSLHLQRLRPVRLKLWCAGQAEARPDEASGKKRPADSERGRSSKAQKTDENERRKREPIAFKPRDSAASGSGRLAENGQREAPADLRRTGSQNEKRSVFERLHSGAGKVRSVSAASQQYHVHSVLQRVAPHAW